MTIITKISCGLGNQMFQYAFGRYLAIKNKTELKLDITEYNTDKLRKYELNKFHIIEHFAKKSEIPLYKIRNSNKIKQPILRYITNLILNTIIYKFLVKFIPGYIQEKDIAFNKKYLETKDNSYLSGFWQSYKYIDEIRDQIIKDFFPKEKLDKKNEELVKQMRTTESVAIHFRRGDYVTQKYIFSPHLLPCSEEYYKKSIQLIKEKTKNPIFFVFSDDIQRVKQNFLHKEQSVFIDGNIGDDSYKDILLMSECKHAIIANSSFSRWGAYLNKNLDKIVFYPKIWFNRKKQNNKTHDLGPKEWIRI